MFSFKKEERLSSKIQISQLFTSGKRLFRYPFQVIYLPSIHTSVYPAKVLITVPKKKIRKSVDRNLLKRRMREAYRLHKHLLYDDLKNQDSILLLAIIYQHNEILDYHRIEKSIIAIFEQLGGME